LSATLAGRAPWSCRDLFQVVDKQGLARRGFLDDGEQLGLGDRVTLQQLAYFTQRWRNGWDEFLKFDLTRFFLSAR
jgi:hypothetical protein